MLLQYDQADRCICMFSCKWVRLSTEVSIQNVKIVLAAEYQFDVSRAVQARRNFLCCSWEDRLPCLHQGILFRVFGCHSGLGSDCV